LVRRVADGERNGLSILLAIMVVTGALFAFTYLERPVRLGNAEPAQPKQPVAQRMAPVPTATPSPQVPSSAAAETPGAIHKCTSGGSVTYSDRPCPGGKGREVDIQVPSGLSDPRMTVARRETSAAQSQLEKSQGDSGTQSVASPARGNATQCQAIDQLIASIDAQARLPRSIPEQNRLRQERAVAVDKRFAFGCHLN
jgi:hypothetical protein